MKKHTVYSTAFNAKSPGQISLKFAQKSQSHSAIEEDLIMSSYPCVTCLL